MNKVIAFIACLSFAGCTLSAPSGPERSIQQKPPAPGKGVSVQAFGEVVRRVQPVAERECRQRAKKANCSFKILLDDRPGQPVNAYQTEDKTGRPVLVFTLPLLKTAQNADELAFIFGHEAAHHIRGHLARSVSNAGVGALILAGVTAIAGGSKTAIDIAGDIGADLGARRYSKNYELEADELGTVIAKRAGYDPVRGAAFFTRIPDPGDRFLGTHPPNSSRVDIVRETAAKL